MDTGYGVTASRLGLPEAFEEALRRLEDEVVSGVEKGMPDTSLRLGEIGKQGWNVLAGDVPLPVMVLKREAFEHNVALMQSYCHRHGAWLASHIKTPMAPQLWAEQLRAGAWAISVANVAQLQVARTFGMQRILVANELVADYDIRYVGQQLREDPNLELYVLVDSLEGVRRLTGGLREAEAGRALRVLVEMGPVGGRCGVRDPVELEALADAVLDAEPVLYLTGVEGYEGGVPGATDEELVDAVDEFLRELADVARAVRSRVPEREPFIVSAGGSSYFDRVVAILGREALPEAQLLLRSGSYAAHDSGYMERISPMGSQSSHPIAGERLRPALELWCVVLSRPEPELAILGMGKRDMPFDLGLPIPLFRARGKGRIEALGEGYEMLRSHDQHTFMRVPAGADLEVGDRLGCGISHPCTAFDKWRTMFVVDSERTIVGAVRTFF